MLKEWLGSSTHNHFQTSRRLRYKQRQTTHHRSVAEDDSGLQETAGDADGSTPHQAIRLVIMKAQPAVSGGAERSSCASGGEEGAK